jgi:hypothetical protein
MPTRLAAFAFAGLALAGCASRPDFAAAPPVKTLVLEEALVGRIVADGALTTLTGDETKFTVQIDGSWDGRVLTLVEDFVFADGSKDRKTWRLTKTAPGRFTGTREDVIGEATAYQDGPGVRLEYQINMDTPVGKLDLTFQDLLYLQPDGSVRNLAIVSKWGLRVARVDLTMRKAGAGS